eukprot:12822882-Ditylum_brightwellii.AAC.1
MACNGKITQHGKKSGGKTLQKSRTITPTANVATTTVLEDIAPKKEQQYPHLQTRKDTVITSYSK